MTALLTGNIIFKLKADKQLPSLLLNLCNINELLLILPGAVWGLKGATFENTALRGQTLSPFSSRYIQAGFLCTNRAIVLAGNVGTNNVAATSNPLNFATERELAVANSGLFPGPTERVAAFPLWATALITLSNCHKNQSLYQRLSSATGFKDPPLSITLQGRDLWPRCGYTVTILRCQTDLESPGWGWQQFYPEWTLSHCFVNDRRRLNGGSRLQVLCPLLCYWVRAVEGGWQASTDVKRMEWKSLGWQIQLT